MNYSSDYFFNSQLSYCFLHKIMPHTKGHSVLDIGCADGVYLETFGEGSVGLDFSPNNIEIAKGKNLKVFRQDMNNPTLLDRNFEVVFMSHILEHVENPINLLRYAHESLLTGGSLIVSVPNEIGLIHFKYPYFSGDGNHLYSFSDDNLHELLEYTGFKIKLFYYEYQTAFTTKLHLNSILTLADYLPRFVRRHLAWAYWVVAEKC